LALQGVVKLHTAPLHLKANFDLSKPDKRREFLRVKRNAQGGLDLFPNQSSGVLTSVVWGDGVVDNPGSNAVQSGDLVRFYPFSEWLQ
jgi:molybdopterin molybdotransferase